VHVVFCLAAPVHCIPEVPETAALLAVYRQAYVKQHLGPATAALHQLPVARGQLCEQGRYWRLVFSSSQQLRHAAWWRAGAKQLLRSCTGLPQTPAAGGSAHSAPLQCQQGPGTHGQDAFCSTAAATGSSTAGESGTPTHNRVCSHATPEHTVQLLCYE
jgi:hypothetical protein